MFSIFGPGKTRRTRLQTDHSPFSSTYASPVVERDRGYFSGRHASQWSQVESQAMTEDHDHEEDDGQDEDEEADEDGRETTPLLPIFSAAHLGMPGDPPSGDG